MSNKGPRPSGDAKSAAIFGYIAGYKTEHDGLSPNVREICRALDISSTSIVAYHLRRLEAAGDITRMGNHGIKITRGEWRMNQHD